MEYLIGLILFIIVFKILSKHLFIKDNPISKPESVNPYENTNTPKSNSNYHPSISTNQNYYHKNCDDTKITLNDFQLRPSLMNSNERVFFEKLKIAVGEAYDIYPQVHLGAIFQPIKHWHNRGEISRLNKKIDFVLFDKNTQTPKIAIELDGYSHSSPKSSDRDEFVRDIFAKFNIPLDRFNNGNYSVEEIIGKLAKYQN